MKKITLLVLAVFAGFTIHAQIETSFEAVDGWVEASIDAQNGWTSNAAANTLINSLNASEGTMSLQLVPTNGGALTIAFSPLSTSTQDVVTVTVDMFVESNAGTQSTVELATQTPAQGFLTSRVAFNPDDTVGVLDDLDGMGTLGFAAAGTFTRDIWFEFQVEHRFGDGEIRYYIDGNLIYTGTVFAGTIVEQVLPLFNNMESGAFFDDLRYQDGALSVEEYAIDTSVSLFPNPTNGDLNINLTNGFNAKTIDIINVNGQTVLSSNVNGTRNKINTNALAAGLYFAKIASEDTSTTIKFIKN
jgi:hypothetical protein